MPYFLVVSAMAAIVAVLIFIQLLRAHPVDLFSSLIIAACFVVAVVVTAMWSNRSKA